MRNGTPRARLARALGLLALSLLIPASSCHLPSRSREVLGPTKLAEPTATLPSPSTHSPPPSPEAAPTTPGTPLSARTLRWPSPNKLGVHLLLDDGRNVWSQEVWPDHLRRARQAVGEWGYVTELIRLDDLNPIRWQAFFDLCAEFHLTPILRLATTYNRRAEWWGAAPPDEDGTYRTTAARYAEFVAALRWPTAEHFIIVGNEPNHGNEWSGRPDPAAYGRFLIDVADAVHQADPNARVLNAGLDPYTPHTGSVPFVDGQYYIDSETFLDQMYAAYPDAFNRLDVWASHSYPTGPLTEGPWQQVYQVDMINDARNPDHIEPPPGIHNRGINGYEWELFKLSTYGVPHLPVMITETGWRHAESTDEKASDNGRPLPSAATVAQYLDLALRGNGRRYPELPEDGWKPWLTDPRIAAVTPFALNGHPAEWGHSNWLALDADGRVVSTYAPFDLLSTYSTPP